ncbi:Fc.00g037100.m01.CDS01 [Cosmosporella sp. VM-42]
MTALDLLGLDFADADADEPADDAAGGLDAVAGVLTEVVLLLLGLVMKLGGCCLDEEDCNDAEESEDGEDNTDGWARRR